MKAWIFSDNNYSPKIEGASYITYKDIEKVKNYNSEWGELVEKTVNNGIDTVITSIKYLNVSVRLLWSLDNVKYHYIYDSDDRYHIEHYNARKQAMIWDYVANKSNDERYDPIKQSGWISAFTGDYFSKDEIAEFIDDTYLKLQDYITNEKNVMDIGCASGLSLFKIAPLVNQYHAIDISESTLERTANEVKARNISEVSFYISDANAIDNLDIHAIDICIVNSVAQYFAGYNYLFSVIKKIINSMNDKGIVFFGDVLDLSLRSVEKDELKKLGNGASLNETDLWYPKILFESLPFYFSEISSVKISKKTGKIENELTKYRYDVLIKIDKENNKKIGEKPKLYGIEGDLEWMN